MIGLLDAMLTAAEIDSWAKSEPRRAQEILPELLIRLILCTSDDIENYNSMIERDVRTPSKNVIKSVVRILCKSVFDFIPDDIDIEFESLRILKETEEEALRTSKYNRFRDMYANGLITKGELYDLLTSENVISQSLKIKDDDDYYDVTSNDFEAMKNVNQGSEL